MAEVRITSISYGRTIVMPKSGRRNFSEEKRWFGFEAEVGHNESPSVVLDELRRRAEDFEERERQLYNEENL